MRKLLSTLIIGAIMIYGFSFLTGTNYFNMPGIESEKSDIEKLTEWKKVKVRVTYMDGETEFKELGMPTVSELIAVKSDYGHNLVSTCKNIESEFIRDLKIIGCESVLVRNIKHYSVIETPTLWESISSKFN